MKHRWFFVLRVDCLKDSKQSAFKFICVCAVRVRVYAAKASLFFFPFCQLTVSFLLLCSLFHLLTSFF